VPPSYQILATPLRVKVRAVLQMSGLYYFQQFPAVTTDLRLRIPGTVRVSTDCGSYFYIPNTDTRCEVISENVLINSVFKTSITFWQAAFTIASMSVAATPTDPSVLSETISDLVIGSAFRQNQVTQLYCSEPGMTAHTPDKCRYEFVATMGRRYLQLQPISCREPFFQPSARL